MCWCCRPHRGRNNMPMATGRSRVASWLGWPFTKTAISARAEKPRILCHVFTERPIYRPEEAVEIRGFVRRYLHGALADIDGTGAGGKGTLLVQGPDKQEWRYPVTLDDTSGFYLHFDAKTEATGDYTVSFQPEKEADCDSAGFKKEAYRLPTFEVLLNNPPRVPLDAPFQVGLVARYYAGGVVTDRPIKWRVTQFPVHVVAAWPRGVSVLQRRAVLRRAGVSFHACHGE